MKRSLLALLPCCVGWGFVPPPSASKGSWGLEIQLREVLEYQSEGSSYIFHRVGSGQFCQIYLPLQHYPEIQPFTRLGIERARLYGTMLYLEGCLDRTEREKLRGPALEEWLEGLKLFYDSDANEIKVTRF